MKPVAIIGGGITGLTAAFCLKQRGIPVLLLEAADRVGGVIQSVRRDGYLAEFGPNSILETSPVISDLVRDLGLESRRVYSNPSAEKRYVVRDKKPVAIPNFRGRLSDDAPVFAPGQAACSGRAVHRAGRRTAWKNPSRNSSCGGWARNFLITPLIRWWPGFTPATRRMLSVPQAFPKLHALEQRYRSLFLGQGPGRARAQTQRGSFQAKREEAFL